VVSDSAGRLVVSFGPSFTGDAEHWHFDTFKVTWRDPALGDTWITFTLDARGEVASLHLQDVGDFPKLSHGDTAP